MSKPFILVKLRSDLMEFRCIIMINRFIFNGISFAKMRFELGKSTGDVESDIKSTLHKIYVDHVVLRCQQDFSGLLERLESKIIDGRSNVRLKNRSRDERQLENCELIEEDGCLLRSNREEAKNCLRVQYCCKDERRQHQHDSASWIDRSLTEQRTKIDEVPANNRLFKKEIRADEERDVVNDNVSREITTRDKPIEGGEIILEPTQSDSSAVIVNYSSDSAKSNVKAKKIIQIRSCDQCESAVTGDLGHFPRRNSCDTQSVETKFRNNQTCCKTLDEYLNIQSYWEVSHCEDRSFVKIKNNCQCSEARDVKQLRFYGKETGKRQEHKKMGLLETSVEKIGTEFDCDVLSEDIDILDRLENEIIEFNGQIEREIKQVETNLYHYMMINMGYSFLILKEKAKINQAEKEIKRLKVIWKDCKDILKNEQLSLEAFELRRQKLEERLDGNLLEWQDNLEILRLQESIIMADVIIARQREQIVSGSKLIHNLDEIIREEKQALRALEECMNSEQGMTSDGNDNDNFENLGSLDIRRDSSRYQETGIQLKYSLETYDHHVEDRSCDHRQSDNVVSNENLDFAKERNTTCKIPLTFENEINKDDNTSQERKKISETSCIFETDTITEETCMEANFLTNNTTKETKKKVNLLTDLDKNMITKDRNAAHEAKTASKHVIEHQNYFNTNEKQGSISKESNPATSLPANSTSGYDIYRDSYLDYKCQRWMKRLTAGSNLLRVPVEKYPITNLTNHRKGAPRALGRSKRGKSRNLVKDTIYQSDIVEV